MASEQALQLDTLLRAGPKAVDMELAEQRAAGEHQEDFTSEPVGVRYEDVPELGGFWAVPEEGDPGGAVVYLYGGGYVISSPQSRRKTAGHLAAASGTRVLVPRYRLAPEHPFPAAVQDATRAVEWLAEHGHPAGQVIVAGDSSAGGLTLATLLALRDAGQDLPAGAVTLSPWCDLACTGPSFEDNAAADLSVTRAALERMAGQYLAGTAPTEPLASPLYGDLTGLPPLLIVAGGAEVLLDDALRFTRKAALAGVDVTLRVGAGMQHIYPVYAGYLPEADAAIAEIGSWIGAQLKPDQ